MPGISFRDLGCPSAKQKMGLKDESRNFWRVAKNFKTRISFAGERISKKPKRISKKPKRMEPKGDATPSQLTGGATVPKLRGGLIPAAHSRRTPVRVFLSPSLRPHNRDSISAAARSCASQRPPIFS